MAVTALPATPLASADQAQQENRGQEAGVARSFPELRDRLRIGDKILVTVREGYRLEGTIESLLWEASALTLKAEPRERTGEESITLSQGDIRKIELETEDPIWNGTLIGFGIGTVVMAVPSYRGCEGDAACVASGSLILGGGVGAAIGALSDFVNKRRQTVYSVDPPSSVKVHVGFVVNAGRARSGIGVLAQLKF
jgi:hypothetical protein